MCQFRAKPIWPSVNLIMRSPRVTPPQIINRFIAGSIFLVGNATYYGNFAHVVVKLGRGGANDFILCNDFTSALIYFQLLLQTARNISLNYSNPPLVIRTSCLFNLLISEKSSCNLSNESSRPLGSIQLVAPRLIQQPGNV